MSDACEIAKVEFTAQAQRFVRSAVFCAVPLGLAFGDSCFWGVGCGRAIGFAFQDIAAKLTSLS